MAKAIIATNGNFPAEYNVLQANKDGIYEVVFGPDPDLADAQRKADELNGVRARDNKGHYVADDPSTPDINEAYVGGKAPKKKAKKKTKKK
mgnify:FL=1|jgi:hypothetical protein|tara:strand:+ start:520 stop:792 length:273 start_codon:yes stop_codon:yes gene_type:complete